MQDEEGMLPDEEGMRSRVPETSHSPAMWLGLTALALIAGLSLFALVRARSQARELDASRAQAAEALSQAQSQIQALSAKIDALHAAEQARELAAVPPAPPMRPKPRRNADDEDGDARAPAHRTRRPESTRVVLTRNLPQEQRPREDPRVSKVEAQLAEQKQELAKTRDDLSKAQTDLQGRIGSTRDELHASIAMTHDQLVDLQKRGERNYYEFQMYKGKDFLRVGPISIALRKVNTKHDYYDMTLQLDDVKLEKKHVNLYEPVWINLNDHAQPVELVVNQISKDHVQGYLSAPKYKKSELASSGGTPGQPAQQLQQR